MAIKVYRLGEGPQPTRHKRRRLEDSDEWISLRAKMADGIKPYEEVVLELTPADMARFKMKNSQRVFRDMAKDWIRRNKLSYTVEAFKSGGLEMIRVYNMPLPNDETPKEPVQSRQI